MSATKLLVRAAMLVALASALGAGCSKSGSADNACETDLDCTAPGTRCEATRRVCVCANDEACLEDEFCNGAGACQRRSGCTDNADCASQPNTYCDLSTGRCLSGPALQLSGACGLASHCPYGTICVAGGTGPSCEVGCFDDGDCVLGEVCVGGICASGEGLCSGDDFCGYKERCTNNECRPDRRGPYCRGCSQRTAANPEPCDDPKNFCLINSAERGGFRQFCGVDCSLGQPCPNGYDCNGVVILTDQPCTTLAQCQCDPRRVRFATRTCTITESCVPRNGDGTPAPDADFCVLARHPDCNDAGGGDAACLVPRGQTGGFCTCGVDADCADGARCIGGQCCGGEVDESRTCAVGESRVSGFCTCATDDDCPRDSCDPSRGACAISGNPCTPGGGECGPIPCVNGGCLIGQNCAPIQGLACSDVGG